ncbi:MAG: hypothetical protein M9945_14350 [Aquamicrobium sp.]|uniref:hypothetical protein n=1 Tax=Aquamicrobium sp. TaxID=1872579 RepID=UPI00349EAEC4|nr:hypothetical protein [Aquamicrobium sp.]
MAVNFLKTAKKAAPPMGVKFLLHKHLSGYDPARSISRIHASDLTKEGGICPRYYALHDLTGQKPKDQWLTTSERMTFQIGRDQERNIVLWFAEMGRAVCHWKCTNCGTVHDFTLRPAACKHCGCKWTEPKEVRFESAICGASCGIDMLVKLNQPKLRVTELKTMDKEEFKALKAPLAEHQWRTNLYLRLIAESAHPWSNQVDTEEATILYVSKGGYGCQDAEPEKWGMFEKYSPFKEFAIKRNDALTDGIVNRAKVVTDFRKGLIPSPCGICSNALTKRAMKCPMKKHCFSGEYPAQHEWKDV